MRRINVYPWGDGGGEGGAKAVGRSPCGDGVVSEAWGEGTTRVGRWRGGSGERAGARDVGRAGSVGETRARGRAGGGSRRWRSPAPNGPRRTSPAPGSWLRARPGGDAPISANLSM